MQRLVPNMCEGQGTTNHHKKGALKEQSLIQLDYTYIRTTLSNQKAHAIVLDTPSPLVIGESITSCQVLVGCEAGSAVEPMEIIASEHCLVGQDCTCQSELHMDK
eukprot:5223919-Amphidinium_carterae.2